ncbi:zinc finger and C2 domain-containing protein [Capsaspora owczarzaki ATCC 30864]|uniref:Zinc finger and C2 domain-containing protein n=1 Tax=Capsaspora owczarzaki (strain ATCC 30864) TaxID=595528 RepID=A0A0D2X3E9_CAPO3|nr:zinc finger and C2 domain-containing protein [Capsaspora owczarzaki ATCC 30864]KJE94189.1 zinc finger and C2 domain-containing protein [Capsaspora owczarzaki ATCC 30864]|eukprot:XP_004347620.1 zinc finger and C2 domain-containing protein [Capsaspora owczarzaki ATCC 30864]
MLELSLSDVAADSPNFRSRFAVADALTGDLEQRLKSIAEAARKHVEATQLARQSALSLLEQVRAWTQQHLPSSSSSSGQQSTASSSSSTLQSSSALDESDDETTTAYFHASLMTLTGSFLAVEDQRDMLCKQLQRMLVEPVESFLSNDVRRVKEQSSTYHRAQAEVESAIDRYSAVKPRDYRALSEAATTLREARRNAHRLGCRAVILINQLHERSKSLVPSAILEALIGHSTFAQLTYSVVKTDSQSIMTTLYQTMQERSQMLDQRKRRDTDQMRAVVEAEEAVRNRALVRFQMRDLRLPEPASAPTTTSAVAAIAAAAAAASASATASSASSPSPIPTSVVSALLASSSPPSSSPLSSGPLGAATSASSLSSSLPAAAATAAAAPLASTPTPGWDVSDPSVAFPFLANGVRAGYLNLGEKKPYGLSWSRCYFTIQDGLLVQQQRRSKLTTSSVSENLRICTVKPTHDVDRNFCFSVISPRTTLLLQAESSDEMQAWLMAIQNAIASALTTSSASDSASRTGSNGGGLGQSLSVEGAMSGSRVRRAGSYNALNEVAEGDDLIPHSSSFQSFEQLPPVDGDASDGLLNTSGSTASNSVPSAAITAELMANPMGYLTALPSNDVCADCGAPRPEWASINLGIVLCIECSGIHRSFGVHISQVRSLLLDTWRPEWAEPMLSITNARSNSIFEARVPAGMSKPRSGSSRKYREDYITMKYVDLAFMEPLKRQDVLAGRLAKSEAQRQAPLPPLVINRPAPLPQVANLVATLDVTPSSPLDEIDLGGSPKMVSTSTSGGVLLSSDTSNSGSSSGSSSSQFRMRAATSESNLHAASMMDSQASSLSQTALSQPSEAPRTRSFSMNPSSYQRPSANVSSTAAVMAPPTTVAAPAPAPTPAPHAPAPISTSSSVPASRPYMSMSSASFAKSSSTNSSSSSSAGTGATPSTSAPEAPTGDLFSRFSRALNSATKTIVDIAKNEQQQQQQQQQLQQQP